MHGFGANTNVQTSNYFDGECSTSVQNMVNNVEHV